MTGTHREPVRNIQIDSPKELNSLIHHRYGFMRLKGALLHLLDQGLDVSQAYAEHLPEEPDILDVRAPCYTTLNQLSRLARRSISSRLGITRNFKLLAIQGVDVFAQ